MQFLRRDGEDGFIFKTRMARIDAPAFPFSRYFPRRCRRGPSLFSCSVETGGADLFCFSVGCNLHRYAWWSSSRRSEIGVAPLRASDKSRNIVWIASLNFIFEPPWNEPRIRCREIGWKLANAENQRSRSDSDRSTRKWKMTCRGFLKYGKKDVSSDVLQSEQSVTLIGHRTTLERTDW